MKKLIVVLLFFTSIFFAQEKQRDTIFKKRVLEKTEVDFLMSYYTQDGGHAAVTGGIGTEKLTDITPTFIVALPLNDDDVLTAEVGISAYTSASSSNINPFDGNQPASPWIESSGASSKDTWVNGNFDYSHSSDDRNTILGANLSVASEYDYFSIGFGGHLSKLFNEKNTELTVKANAYIDTWNPQYPTELRSGFKAPLGYTTNYKEFEKLGRNTYSLSFSFSQILTKKMQASLFLDVVHQNGLLSTPHQRVYFADKQDFFIDNFHIADDVERLPETRFKLPIGMRLNYFINEYLTFRSYYRLYTDNWGITAHTAEIELPVKITRVFTVVPTYRYYTQTAADYFSEYNTHLSTQKFYTSDYDLSKFNSNQYGIGIRYTDIFTKFRIFKLGLKSIDLKYSNYNRSDRLKASIISGGVKFILD
ncbi:MAG: DUF3570 domain-containing protein [Flavobacteriaceae bacterium]|nr:DUF3570 domain-containing protein [Flavobacteriaceae bacterium]